MKISRLVYVAGLLLIYACSPQERQTRDNLYQQISELPAIEGKSQYLSSPFVTAGDRVYIIGYQDGSFPDLGWHITGEMGGIWDHPIKLMDGFTASIAIGNTIFCLDQAKKFINYPLANSHQFEWEQEQLSINRFQFIPDGVEGAVIEYQIKNNSSALKDIKFAFTGMVDLRPTWLGERAQMIDADDVIEYNESSSSILAKDSANPWFVVFGSTLTAGEFSSQTKNCVAKNRTGLGKDATLIYKISLQPGESKIIPVYIAGSYYSKESVLQTFELLKKDSKNKLEQKIARYQQIDAASRLTIPDKEIEQMYRWLKYNIDWLIRDVPEQGRSISAGLPDYPWWFGADMTYTIPGILATGDHELAKSSIQLLYKLSKSENDNGRIVHEVSTNGVVFNPGNVNETAQAITMLKHYVDWTGDKELLTQLYPEVKKGITWLLKEKDTDKNGYPNGNGMMEIPGLDTEMIDVVAYTQQALVSATELARIMDDTNAATEYERKAAELKSKINAEWWSEKDKSFGDFRGSREEAMPILEAALIRADTLQKPWAVKELLATKSYLKNHTSGRHEPYVIYHNWVVNTPMETGVADFDKGKAALVSATKYENPFGVYVTGIDRTEEPDSAVLKSRKKTFSYLGAVMTLPTGVQAVASARYGTPDQSLRYIKKLYQSFSYALPGSMYEVSPDFGMITQAWNIYGVAVPIINYFFGIQPKAYEQTISISPRLPTMWGNVSIENVRVGNNALSLTIRKTSEYKEYTIHQNLPEWNLLVDIKNSSKVIVNGSEVDLKSLKQNILKLNGMDNRILIYEPSIK
ncbi:MAG: glycogen debranching protein [Cyclobacteriaceae bacterium]|nr:glycogen debranching protein [Cyclobacteriaceae bacterium]